VPFAQTFEHDSQKNEETVSESSADDSPDQFENARGKAATTILPDTRSKINLSSPPEKKDLKLQVINEENF
jgi:hypothetical protein